MTVPIFVTVPRTDGASACPGMPVGGWPVAIVQHGITRNRTDAVAIADSFADACTIVVSMDLPLHGITSTDPANPLTQLHCFLPPAAPNPACLGAYERTFDVDLDGTPGPDSSAPTINPASPTHRSRQPAPGEATIQLARFVGLAVARLHRARRRSARVGVNADPRRRQQSACRSGSIVGGASGQYMAADITTSTALSVPGGVITSCCSTRRPSGRRPAGLQAQGLTPDSTPFGQFFRDFQTVIDSGDPFNHILPRRRRCRRCCSWSRATRWCRTTRRSGSSMPVARRRSRRWGVNPVAAGAGKWSYFIEGSHGTLFDRRPACRRRRRYRHRP